MRVEQLTFTRFLAAISIVVFHYGGNIFPFNIKFIHLLFKQANMGVSYFFILSGFVMVIAYKDKVKIEYGDYIKRRFARIYPVYGLAILILLAYWLALKKPIDYKGLFLNLTLLQSWIPGYALSFNGTGWSLAVEMFFYFTFPFLFNYIYRRYTLKKLVIPIFLIFIVSQILLHVILNSPFYKGYPFRSHDFTFYFPLMHLNEFLIGNLAGIFFIRGIKTGNYDFPVIGLSLLISILLIINFGLNYHNGMLAFVFVPFILLISSNNGLITKIFNMKPLVYLGEISYGIYILQMPLYNWVTGVMKYLNIKNPTVVFYLYLILLVLFSAISFTYFETPLRKLINRIHIKDRKVQSGPKKQSEELWGQHYP